MTLFNEVNQVSDVATNILKKRYFHPGETKWSEVVTRVINHVLKDADDEQNRLLMK